MLGAGVALVVVGAGVAGGAGGTSAGGSGGAVISSGARVVGAVVGAVVGGFSGAVGEAVRWRGAGRLETGAGWRAWVFGAISVRAEDGGGTTPAGGGAAIWSTAEPGERVGSERLWPRVSQPISAHSTAWPTTSATAMRTVRRTVRVTGTGSTRRTLWQGIDVVES